MDKTITFSVNGRKRSVTTSPERSLLEVLREDLLLTGTKYGCGEGQCRACTVLLNGESVASCTLQIVDVDQKNVLTIEGLAKGETLHPVQEAFLAEGAFQCGYCTSGMILGAVALLRAKPHPTDAEIVAGMQKHVCRCCSYPRIMRAVRRAAESSQPAMSAR